MSGEAQSPGAQYVPQITMRTLTDRSSLKRKQGALEVENIIRELHSKKDGPDEDAIRSVIVMLVNDYAYSNNSNSRKGGLIGLAACSIALTQDTDKYLQMVLPAILKCFQDQESRVRYYACEALYNVTKVVRGSALVFFNEIFDGLVKLYADVDIDVKNGAQLLDRLMMDVVAESAAFNVEKFIPLLRERIRIRNPYIRQLLVGWITVLDSVPELNMLSYLPEYLGGLFEMLSDPNKDIRQQAYAALSDLLCEVCEVNNADDNENEFSIELGPLIPIFVKHMQASDDFTRLTVLTWLHDCIQLGRAKLLPFVATILESVLVSISDQDQGEISRKSEEVNNILLELVESNELDAIALEPLVQTVCSQLDNKWVPSRLASLRWISMLLAKSPTQLFKLLDSFFPALLKTLQDVDDQVVKLDLEVMSRVALDEKLDLDQQKFNTVLTMIVDLCNQDRKFLERRGEMITRQLCTLLDAEAVYKELASILKDAEPEFASLMVQQLNLILLTCPELFELRRALKNALLSKEGSALFTELLQTWVHNPVSTFAMCLLVQAYELASSLVFMFGELEITVGFLLQIDKLVQLIESPIFLHLRLQLLEPTRYPFLLKCLYGLLMLLPQSAAFTSLKRRLGSVAPLGLMNCIPNSPFAKSINFSGKETKQLDFKKILKRFEEVQQRHSDRRKEAMAQRRLLKSQKEEAGAAAASSKRR